MVAQQTQQYNTTFKPLGQLFVFPASPNSKDRAKLELSQMLDANGKVIKNFVKIKKWKLNADDIATNFSELTLSEELLNAIVDQLPNLKKFADN